MWFCGCHRPILPLSPPEQDMSLAGGGNAEMLLPCAVEAWTMWNISVGLVQEPIKLLKGSADVVALGEEGGGGSKQMT